MNRFKKLSKRLKNYQKTVSLWLTLRKRKLKTMAFNKPANGRGEQSGRSSGRPSKGGDSAKKTSSSSRGRSSPGTERTGSGPAKKYSTERSGEKKSFSSDNKPYNRSGGDDRTKKYSSERSGEKKSFSSDSKPYNRSGSDDRAKSSFSGGDKKSFAPKRPYSGRPSDGESSGERKSFTPRNKPYSGRVTGDDRPAKSFGSRSSEDKKDFVPKGRAYSEKPTSSRPPKSFSNDPSKERKSSSTGSSEKFGEKKFSRPATGTGFKKREGDFKEKPFRKSFDKSAKDNEAPAKTMRPKKPSTKDDGLIRLNRYIANAGICSRRKADELIQAGVVTVNGEVVAELGAKVNPMKDEIRYNGETLKREKMVYVILNKPKDYITTTDDPQERRTVMHLVEKASRERIYPVGRLDRNTTGLLLMTNDGDLADKLSHPRSQITKLYQVELSKSLAQGDLNKIQFGLELEDGLIKPDSVSYVAGASKREIGIQIHSGKNRVVRRIFEHLGYEVVKLDRVVYAGLTKKDLPRGRWRFLEEKEIIQLKHLIK